MKMSFYRVLLLSTYTFCCVAGDGWLGWVFGEQDASGGFSEAPPTRTLPPSSEDTSRMDLNLVDAPFELQREDAFLNEVEKYTGLKMSELDRCQHQIIYNLKTACAKMSEEDIAKMGVQLLNCQSHVEGRKIYRCTPEMSLKGCTSEMDANAWNAYHLMSNRARAVCYAARQQQFAVRTELTVNRLVRSTQDHIQELSKIKEGQDELGRLTSATLQEVSRGQEALAVKQTQLKEAQRSIHGFVSENLRELSKEKMLIAAVQSELDSMGKTLRDRLDEAAEHLKSFEVSRRSGHEEILKDIKEVHAKTREAWEKVDGMTAQVLALHGQTLGSLSKINSSIAFLQTVMENLDVQVNDKLKWLNNTLSLFNTDEMGRLEDLFVIISHVVFLLVAALLSSFLHIPMFSRVFMIFAIPLNAASFYTDKDLPLDFPSLSLVILFVLGLEILFRVYGSTWLRMAKIARGSAVCSGSTMRNIATPIAAVAPATRMSRIAGGQDIAAFSDADDECGGGEGVARPDGVASGSVRRRRGGAGTPSLGEAVVGVDRSAQRPASSSLFPPFCSTPRVDAPTGEAPGPPPLSRVPLARGDPMCAPSTSGGGQPRLPMAVDLQSAKRSLLNRLLQDQSERRVAAEISDEDGDAFDEPDEGEERLRGEREDTPVSYSSSARTPGGRSRRSGSANAPLCAGKNRQGANCRKAAIRGTLFCIHHQQ